MFFFILHIRGLILMKLQFLCLVGSQHTKNFRYCLSQYDFNRRYFFSKATGIVSPLMLPDKEHECICCCHISSLYYESKVQTIKADFKFYRQLTDIFSEIVNKTQEATVLFFFFFMETFYYLKTYEDLTTEILYASFFVCMFAFLLITYDLNCFK